MFNRRRTVFVAFAALVVFWGSSFPVIKIGLDYSPPLLFAGLRTLLGGVAMALVATIWGGRPHLRRDWPVFALLALFNVMLFVGLQTLAVQSLPSGTAAVLVYLQPILVGFLAWLLLGEPLSAGKLVGLSLGFSGIVAVSAGSLSGDISLLGVAFGAGSALFWASGTVYFKRVQERVATLWSVAIPFLAGGTVLTGLGMAGGETVSGVRWTAPFLASLAYSSLIGIALAWVMWFGLVRAGEASRVAAYIFIVPLVSIFLGVVFLGENLSFYLVLGAMLVVFGIYLVNRSPAGKS